MVVVEVAVVVVVDVVVVDVVVVVVVDVVVRMHVSGYEGSSPPSPLT